MIGGRDRRKWPAFVSRFYPEVNAGGFSSVDGGVEFYGRVNALLDRSSAVLDFGAGRGGWFDEDRCSFRRNLRLLQGKAKRVVGCDLDEVVLKNPSLDEAVLLREGVALPFAPGEFDLIVSDFTFEHITDPEFLADEFKRILKPGGWICARTPNRYSYPSIATRLLKNSVHERVLRRAQPCRREEDVFPTVYRLNSLGEVRRAFPREEFFDCSYRHESEPVYHGNNFWVYSLFYALNKVTPKVMKTQLHIFLQKR